MWQLIWFLQGYVQAELRGASPEWALERLSNARVAFLRVQRIDDFTIALLILRKDVLKAEAAARKAMCELAVVREMGFGKTFGGLWRRRLFVLGLLLCAAGAFAQPATARATAGTATEYTASWLKKRRRRNGSSIPLTPHKR